MQSVNPKHAGLTAGSDLPMAARTVWLLSWAVELSVVAFVGLVGTAMTLYPGGTFWDRTRTGHAFWENFLCDLVQTKALGGGENVHGANLASLGMLCLVGGMLSFVGLVPTLLGDARRMTRQVKAIAVIACGIAACVPLLPTDRFGALHAAAVFGAGIPLWLSLVALVANLLQKPDLPSALQWVSMALCAAVGLSLMLYAAEVCFAAPAMRIVPVVSRLSTLSLLAWLVGVSRMARDRAASELSICH